jgi:hypothetical protein
MCWRRLALLTAEHNRNPRAVAIGCPELSYLYNTPLSVTCHQTVISKHARGRELGGLRAVLLTHKSKRSKKTLLRLHHPEDEATKILRNDANYTPNETA